MADFLARGVPKRVVRHDYHKPSITESPSAIAEVVPCPTCGASGDDPCTTASGNVKDTWHSRREA